MSLRDDEQIVTLKVNKCIVALIDSDRERYKRPRTSWIIQAIIEKLEKLGYDVNE